MAHVEVKNADGAVLHTYEIVLDGNFLTDVEELLFSEARRNAVEDELVSAEEADTLTCRVVG